MHAKLILRWIVAGEPVSRILSAARHASDSHREAHNAVRRVVYLKRSGRFCQAGIYRRQSALDSGAEGGVKCASATKMI